MTSNDIDGDTVSSDGATDTSRENLTLEQTRSPIDRSGRPTDGSPTWYDFHARSPRTRYRKVAVGLAALGLAFGLVGLALSDSRDVLFTLAAAGLFGGLLTYYLSPGRYISVEAGESVYAAAASNESALVDALGLENEPIYVPSDDSSRVRLFVPADSDDRVPEDLTVPCFTDDDCNGLVLEPTGQGLFREFERMLSDDLATAANPLAVALADGLVEGLELARDVDPDVDAADGWATITISDGAFGALDRFDHPIASFLGVGFAVGLGRPIEVDVEPGTDRVDWLVTCRWGPDEHST